MAVSEVLLEVNYLRLSNMETGQHFLVGNQVQAVLLLTLMSIKKRSSQKAVRLVEENSVLELYLTNKMYSVRTW